MREALKTSRYADFFTAEGLRTFTNLSEERWPFVIVKELLDNALDAINDSPDKSIHVEFEGDSLVIADSGPGIPEDVLDDVYDFSAYVSSKRDYRSPTRGFQGNALKTVIGICHMKRWGLTFHTGGKSISYRLDAIKLRAKIMAFQKEEMVSEFESAVVVNGFDVTDYDDVEEIKKSIWSYYHANPDTSFTINGEAFPAIVEPIKRTEKTFIHWYDRDKFSVLLQNVYANDPQKTVKAFCGIFSGTQRVVSRLDFPYKRLCEFDDKEQAIRGLHEQLQELVKAPKPDILKGQAIGQDTLRKIYNVKEEDKTPYKLICAEYQKEEAVIPYVIEGFLFHDNSADSPVRHVTTVNGSVPYDDVPFDFDSFTGCSLGKRRHWVRNLRGVLDKSGFSEATGVVLYLNFICPHIEFTDKAKTRIISNQFKDDLLKVVHHCCKGVIREAKQAKRQRRVFDRQNTYKPQKKTPKNELMTRHFMEAFERASSGYTVTIRQVFYVLREMINRRYDQDLNKGDYQTFTQKIATEYFRNHSELETKILIERRGFFKDPFFRNELPLGTADVLGFIARNTGVKTGIRESTTRMISIPVSLQYNHVLFIEKQGFNAVLEESGLVRELNIGVLSTQGFSTRAAKKLLRWFIEQGIKVYVLHDCDIPGYLIHDKLAHGSDTFRTGLDVEDIGLCLADVRALNKEHQAEVVPYKKKYSTALDILSEDEREFFVVSNSSNEYRRVELNALTNDEFIKLVRDKIKKEPIIPTTEDVKAYINIDKAIIVKNALYAVFKSEFPVEIDTEQLCQKIVEACAEDDTEHWTDIMNEKVNDFMREQKTELATRVKEWITAKAG